MTFSETTKTSQDAKKLQYNHLNTELLEKVRQSEEVQSDSVYEKYWI